MSGFQLLLSVDAIHDIDRYFTKIQQLPSASTIRYDQVRVKPLDTFPFTIR